MKIGIFTLPLENNYGGILQNYALQQVLIEMGHEVLTIDWHRKKEYENVVHHFMGYIHRLYTHFFHKENVSVCWSPFFTDEEFDIISRNIKPFISKNIALTKRTTLNYLSEIDKEYKFDAYVVGSDQVWVHSYAPSAFLEFVERDEVVRVSYAASSNERAWTRYREVIPRCVKLSSSFSGLSVREFFLKKEAEEILHCDIKLVLDPVFLLAPDKYMKLTRLENNTAPFGFDYILDQNEEKTSIIKSISEDRGIQFVSGMPRKAHIREKRMNMDDYVCPSVEDWLYGISQADIVVTDSFHGMAFAILFNKNFVVIANAKRGVERFKSLLANFDLQDRMICSGSEAVKVIQHQIDYNKINKKLEKMRVDSLSFLEQSLSK